jgi:hypothetical protein
MQARRQQFSLPLPKKEERPKGGNAHTHPPFLFPNFFYSSAKSPHIDGIRIISPYP